MHVRIRPMNATDWDHVSRIYLEGHTPPGAPQPDYWNIASGTLS